ncbi:hypothetical protein [Flexivirga meconopsidis]|uniref:hypothetical protein n=1 Tax=Flexivirga meconopsidis TaxID=2977121 RepID=UPI0022407EFA|nr:hypothetical protein [Flexivirga meconopsidis]
MIATALGMQLRSRLVGWLALAALLGSVVAAADATTALVLLAAVVLAALLITAVVVPGRTRLLVTGRRSRAPGVLLASTHPAAPGHPRPRAPGPGPVAPA